MRRVVKIGGSLLLRPRLTHEIAAWLSSQPAAENLVIVGGGQLIEAMRQLDAARAGDQANVHWCCVDLLSITFGVAARWFPAWPRINSAVELQTACKSGFATTQPTLVAVHSFYRNGNEFGLPTDWRTTTDAIAAALAIETAAAEVVLLKSCDVDATASIQELARRGVVDEALSFLADQVPQIRIEKLPSV